MNRDMNTIADMHQLSVGAITAVQLPAIRTSSGIKKAERVLIQALVSNTAPVFAKNAANVNGNGSTGGHEFIPGSNLILPITTYEDYWLIANSGTQKLQVTFLAG